MKFEKKTKCLFWWLLSLIPIIVATALAFNGGLETLQIMANDGMQWGMFGTFFVGFLSTFGTVSWQVCLLVSCVDWLLTVNVAKVAFQLFDVFASWMLNAFKHLGKKEGDLW